MSDHEPLIIWHSIKSQCVEHGGKSHRGIDCPLCHAFVCGSCWEDQRKHRVCPLGPAFFELRRVIDWTLDARAARAPAAPAPSTPPEGTTPCPKHN